MLEATAHSFLPFLLQTHCTALQTLVGATLPCQRGLLGYCLACPREEAPGIQSVLCREAACSCAGRAGGCTVRSGRGAAVGQGRAGQGCVTGRGAGKGLPGGQAAADGVSSVPRGLYHLSRSRGRWDCDFSRLPLGCRTPRCSASGMFWQLNQWGPSLSGVEKHFPCRGTARAAAGEARGESKFLEGPILSEALLVPSDFFPPAFLPLCSQELERERFTC